MHQDIKFWTEFEANIDLMNLYKGRENIKDIWLKKLKKMIEKQIVILYNI